MRVAKLRRCKQCQGYFSPMNSLTVVCGPLCAIAHVKAQKARQLRREKRDGRIRLRTISDWTKLAQAEFNRFIRMRDADKPCISCGRSTDAKQNAGHYLSVGSNPGLRFDERNCHKQCEFCNSFKSGNAVAYRLGLIRRVGQSIVEALEGPHEPKRYRIEDLIGLREEYRRKCKELKNTTKETQPGLAGDLGHLLETSVPGPSEAGSTL